MLGPVSSSSGPIALTDEDADAILKGKELMILPKEFSEPYSVMTTARSAVLMGKYCGMKYDCVDDVVLYQIAAQISARMPA